MTPQAFIAKWSAGAAADALSERAGAQAHFIDLCRLLDVLEPADPEAYCFERGLKKTGGLHGWADVWKRGCSRSTAHAGARRARRSRMNPFRLTPNPTPPHDAAHGTA